MKFNLIIFLTTNIIRSSTALSDEHQRVRVLLYRKERDLISNEIEQSVLQQKKNSVGNSEVKAVSG